VTYSDWAWATKVTNTQWGIDDADTSDNVGPVTLTNKTPTAKVVAGSATTDLVIAID
jgi:hypothetical protein